MYLLAHRKIKLRLKIESNDDETPTRARPWTRDMVASIQDVLQRYMEMHSVDQLRQECSIGKRNISFETDNDCPNFSHRQFAVGFYSCPHQAGNRLHHFMNAMAWAIVTNRTLLWKYYDQGICSQLGREHSPGICLTTGTRETCEQILLLKNWIPSLDEWQVVIGRQHNNSKLVEAPFWSVHSTLTARNATLRKHPPDSNNTTRDAAAAPAAVSIDVSETRLLHFGQLLGNDFARVLSTTKQRHHLLQTRQARATAQQLLQGGTDFLYGMLFHASFSFSDSLLSSLPESSIDSNETTISLHSRHSSLTDDGSNVTREVECLRRILLLGATTRPCRVYVISDRPSAVRKILDAAYSDLHCTVSVVNHTEQTASFTVEHGPFAGAGFFRDLALASRARHGLLGGKRRSSTLLLKELIVFEKLKGGKDDERPFVFCNYGHGCVCETVVVGGSVDD